MVGAIVTSGILIVENISYSVALNAKIIGEKYLLQDIAGKDFRFTEHSSRTMIIYYSPECESCIYEVSAIARNFRLFERFPVYLVSDQAPEKIQQFIVKTSFPVKPQIFLRDVNSRFRDAHKIRFYPTIIIADEGGKIIHRFEGERKIEIILSMLNNE
jgi:hypothetical protein